MARMMMTMIQGSMEHTSEAMPKRLALAGFDTALPLASAIHHHTQHFQISHLLRHPAWKRSGAILKGKLNKKGKQVRLQEAKGNK